MKYSAIIALLGAASATITFDASLKCGKCIKGGFVFCTKGGDGEVVADDGKGVPAAATCCEDSTEAKCSVIKDTAYTCSNTYTDADLARSMCPFREKSCGKKKTIEFTDTTDAAVDIAPTAMVAGETCSYKVKSKKGSPAFRVKKDSTTTDAKTEVTFVEYDESKTEVDTTTGRPKSDKTPKDSGDQAAKKG